MNKRRFPRIKIREQSAIIHNGEKYLAIGSEEREAFALILDLSSGGTQLKSNISCQEKSSLNIQFPNVANFESFAVKSQVVRVQKSPDSEPLKPRYILGLKFTDVQDAEKDYIKKFIDITWKTSKDNN